MDEFVRKDDVIDEIAMFYSYHDTAPEGELINRIRNMQPLECNEKFADMLNELLSLEEKMDYFSLTTRERAEFQYYVEERMS